MIFAKTEIERRRLDIGAAVAHSEVKPCGICKRPILTVMTRPVCSTCAEARRQRRRKPRPRLAPAFLITRLIEKVSGRKGAGH